MSVAGKKALRAEFVGLRKMVTSQDSGVLTQYGFLKHEQPHQEEQHSDEKEWVEADENV